MSVCLCGYLIDPDSCVPVRVPDKLCFLSAISVNSLMNEQTCTHKYKHIDYLIVFNIVIV